MVKQNYRVVLSSDADHVEHAIKRNVDASLAGSRPFAKPDVIVPKAEEAARTVADLWKSMGINSADELDNAKRSMAERFVKTKLDDLTKRYRLQPIGTKKFVDTYWNTLKAAGYDIRGGSKKYSSIGDMFRTSGKKKSQPWVSREYLDELEYNSRKNVYSKRR